MLSHEVHPKFTVCRGVVRGVVRGVARVVGAHCELYEEGGTTSCDVRTPHNTASLKPSLPGLLWPTM